MAISVGRLGWTGIAIESTAGSPLSPTDYIPHSINTMHGKHEPFTMEGARGLRDKEFNSVAGKQWGEGDLQISLDPTFAGYLVKMAMGTENSAQNGATGVYDHTFTVNEAGLATSATLMVDKVAYREVYPYSVCDTLEIDVKDNVATAKMTVKSTFPATTTSGTVTTTSGIVYTFKDLQCQFGSTLAAAQGAAASPLTNFNVKIKNNPEAVYIMGQQTPSSWTMKEFEISGEYGQMLQNQTEVNNYYNLTKQYGIFTFYGRGIGGGYKEMIQLTLNQLRVQDQTIETGITNLYAVKSTFQAEYSKTDSATASIVVRNRKSTTY